jgi:hypothetical protein
MPSVHHRYATVSGRRACCRGPGRNGEIFAPEGALAFADDTVQTLAKEG